MGEEEGRWGEREGEEEEEEGGKTEEREFFDGVPYSTSTVIEERCPELPLFSKT